VPVLLVEWHFAGEG